MMFLASAGVANAQEPENMMILFDKDVYTWTDKVKITIIAHDHNKSSNMVDVLGESDTTISISTKNHTITDFLIHETGPDTGVFSRTITLSGFPHDADGNPNTGDENGNDVLGLDHVKDGVAIGDYLISDDDDTITVKLSTLRNGIENASMESSVSVTWNMGQIKWEKASYDDNGVANVRLIDPDMNWSPDSADNFRIDAWSDSDLAGIDITMTETGDSTGIFEGTVFFDTRESSGHRLHVVEGDTITVEYEDNTLPNPYSPADEINIKDYTIIRNPPILHDLLPPLKQIKNGTALIDVKCDEDKQLVYNHDSTRVVCVSEETHTKLIERGWAKSQEVSDNDPKFTESAKNLDDFIFAFYSEISKQNEQANIFFSPLSISTAFSIAYEGAKGNTASQIQQVFDFESDDRKRQEKISDLLSRLNHEDDWHSLQVANALWIKDGYNVKQYYIDTAKIHYSSTVDNVDFVTDDGVNKINSWVKQKTNDKIQDILAPGSTDELTRMVITNAVYFKGKWGLEFDPRNTSEKLFWTDKDNSVLVSMMKENAAMYNYAETKDLQVLDLNYLGGDISMIVLLPKEKEGLGTLEQSFDREEFDSIKNSMTRQPLMIQIPKFEFETEYDLIKPLKNLGIHDAFDRANADFHGITDEQIYLDKAAHKAFVNVNEEGTEAAAITALVGRLTSGPPEPIAEFVADHPFMFVIQEKESGEILFIGRLVNP
ncbi:MAG: serpin family protein [Nitrosopumilus sp.]